MEKNLTTYNKKRDFNKTNEPKGEKKKSQKLLDRRKNSGKRAGCNPVTGRRRAGALDCGLSHHSLPTLRAFLTDWL